MVLMGTRLWKERGMQALWQDGTRVWVKGGGKSGVMGVKGPWDAWS